MPTQLNLGTSRKSATLCAFVVAALSPFLAANAKGQTIWQITVAGIGPNQKPTYQVSPNSGGCPYQATQDPENLHICKNDTVHWLAQTSVDNSHQMSNEIWMYPQDAALLDKSGKPTQGFHASDGVATDGGKTDPRATLNAPHKYYVSLYDKYTKNWYNDDPNIIIGGKQVEILIEDLKSSCAQLLGAIDSDSRLSEEAKRHFREQAKELCRQINGLKIPLQ